MRSETEMLDKLHNQIALIILVIVSYMPVKLH